MCLDYANKVPQERQKGYGFKTVNSTDHLDEFVGRWPYFNRGGGGCGVKEKRVLHNCVIWKLGRMYRVKHTRIAHTDSSFRNPYPAGVHLYKYFQKVANNSRIVLVCYYTSDKVEDREQLVAMRCTPILALRTHEQKDIFQSLIKSYGIKRAIPMYQKRYAD